MAPDLDRLLRNTAPPPTTAVDVDGIRRRVRRRRLTRRAAGAGLLAVVVALGVVVAPGIGAGPRIPDIADQPSERPTTDDTSDAYGPELDLASFPPLADHGVAFEQDDRIVFVGIDGTVHGHLRGRFADHAGLQSATHLLPIATEGDTVWLDAATGATIGIGNIEIPLIGGHQVTYFADVPAEQRQELVRITATTDGEVAEALATWPELTPYWVTPDHRVVTYLPCGDRSCPRAFDLDMGGAIDVGPGCHVAAILGDFAVTEVCDEGHEVRTWDPAGGGPAARRSLLVPDGTDAEPAQAVSVFGDVVHVAHATCTTHEAMVVQGDRLVPLLSGASVEERGAIPSHLPLGLLPGGEVVLQFNGGAACDAGAAQPGIEVYDRATGERRPVHATSAAPGEARMWAPSSAITSQPGVGARTEQHVAAVVQSLLEDPRPDQLLWASLGAVHRALPDGAMLARFPLPAGVEVHAHGDVLTVFAVAEHGRTVTRHLHLTTSGSSGVAVRTSHSPPDVVAPDGVPADCEPGAPVGERWLLRCAEQVPVSGTTMPVAVLRWLDDGAVSEPFARWDGVVCPPAAGCVRATDDPVVGRYHSVALVPGDTTRLLLQHSGECEVPTALLLDLPTATFLRAHHGARSLGWVDTTAYLVAADEPACGDVATEPGAYRIHAATGEAELLVPRPGITRWTASPGGTPEPTTEDLAEYEGVVWPTHDPASAWERRRAGLDDQRDPETVARRFAADVGRWDVVTTRLDERGGSVEVTVADPGSGPLGVVTLREVEDRWWVTGVRPPDPDARVGVSVRGREVVVGFDAAGGTQHEVQVVHGDGPLARAATDDTSIALELPYEPEAWGSVMVRHLDRGRTVAIHLVSLPPGDFAAG